MVWFWFWFWFGHIVDVIVNTTYSCRCFVWKFDIDSIFPTLKKLVLHTYNILGFPVILSLLINCTHIAATMGKGAQKSICTKKNRHTQTHTHTNTHPPHTDTHTHSNYMRACTRYVRHCTQLVRAPLVVQTCISHHVSITTWLSQYNNESINFWIVICK